MWLFSSEGGKKQPWFVSSNINHKEGFSVSLWDAMIQTSGIRSKLCSIVIFKK